MSGGAEARVRARRLYSSQAFRKIYCEGAAAARTGGFVEDNPYPDQPGWTYTRRLAWARGFLSEHVRS